MLTLFSVSMLCQCCVNAQSFLVSGLLWYSWACSPTTRTRTCPRFAAKSEQNIFHLLSQPPEDRAKLYKSSNICETTIPHTPTATAHTITSLHHQKIITPIINNIYTYNEYYQTQQQLTTKIRNDISSHFLTLWWICVSSDDQLVFFQVFVWVWLVRDPA